MGCVGDGWGVMGGVCGWVGCMGGWGVLVMGGVCAGDGWCVLYCGVV